MKRLFFLFLGIIVFLSTITYTLYARVTRAQIPPPTVSCEEWESPEFAYLRPYQASPCGDSSKAMYCGNSIILYEEVKRGFSGAKEDVCPKDVYDFTEEEGEPLEIDKTYIINMEDMELPIAGNTELTKNSTNSDETLDDSQKMNEYISWYLSGVNNKAEYGEGKNDPDSLINYSGPVQKLLSWYSQAEKRIDSVKSTSEQVTYIDEDEEETVTGVERHNQIVVCAEKSFLGILGKYVAKPCPEGKEYRLKDWKDHLPPLPWDEKYENDPEGYKKDLCEWQGKSYINIPLSDKGMCVENPFSSNEWSDLFSYIPLSSTEDKKSKQPVIGVGIHPQGDTVLNPERPNDYDVFEEVALYFPHTAEDYELSETLNSTFVPESGTSQNIDYKTVETGKDEKGDCKIIDVRTNSGDDLFAEVPPNSYDIKVDPYYVMSIPCNGECVYHSKVGVDQYGNPTFREWWTKGCSGGSVINVRTQTKVPFAKEIYQNTTSGASSTVRRIFPKIEEGAPIECIADLPTVTKAWYEGSYVQSPNYTPHMKEGIPKGIEVIDPTGKRTIVLQDDPKTDENMADFYMPYFGSVYEYFLKAIQTALRPKGYGEPITQGQFCRTQIECGELPDLPKATGSCVLGNGNLTIPESLRIIIEAAAQRYGVPPSLIVGVMYGEGAWEERRGFDWTDENVKNWATCEPTPQCGGPLSAVVPFFEQNWEEISDSIANDLAEIDPARSVPDPCNLLDAIYGLAWDLRRSASGVAAFQGHSCFGIPLNYGAWTNVNGCTWGDSDVETAIRWWEFGTGYNDTYMCATLAGSCYDPNNINCPTGDDCETINHRDPNPSHNGCIWDVYSQYK